MQNPLGWEVGTEREAGRDHWLQFGVFFPANEKFFFLVAVVFCQKHFLEGIFG